MRAADLGYAPRYVELFWASSFFRFGSESTLPPTCHYPTRSARGRFADASRWVTPAEQKNVLGLAFEQTLQNMANRTQETLMATIVFGNVLVFLVICCIVLFRGLDLKKRSNWWYGLYAFISGFMIGFLRSDDNGGYHVVTNLTASFQMGAVFFLILVGSVITSLQRNWAEKYLERSENEHQEKLDNLAESLFKDKSKRK